MEQLRGHERIPRKNLKHTGAESLRIGCIVFGKCHSVFECESIVAISNCDRCPALVSFKHGAKFVDCIYKMAIDREGSPTFGTSPSSYVIRRKRDLRFTIISLDILSLLPVTFYSSPKQAWAGPTK
jgi:hypothetical protein